MKLKSLTKITVTMGRVLGELSKLGLCDHGVRHRYAEFFVAHQLCKKGHEVQLLEERRDKSADIYLPQSKIRIEVKSGKCAEGNWSYASFGKGGQIKSKKFDFCVFVSFCHNEESVKSVLVFTREELDDVATHRNGVARFESTNPCLFMYAGSLKELVDWTKENGVKAFKIEKAVHKTPKQFRNAWWKIRKRHS